MELLLPHIQQNHSSCRSFSQCNTSCGSPGISKATWQSSLQSANPSIGQMASFETVPGQFMSMCQRHNSNIVQRNKYCGTSGGHDWHGEWRGVSSAEFRENQLQDAPRNSKNIKIRLAIWIKSKEILSVPIISECFRKHRLFLLPDIAPPTLSHSSHMPATSQGSNPNSTFEASALPRVSGAGETLYI